MMVLDLPWPDHDTVNRSRISSLFRFSATSARSPAGMENDPTVSYSRSHRSSKKDDLQFIEIFAFLNEAALTISIESSAVKKCLHLVQKKRIRPEERVLSGLTLGAMFQPSIRSRESSRTNQTRISNQASAAMMNKRL